MSAVMAGVAGGAGVLLLAAGMLATWAWQAPLEGRTAAVALVVAQGLAFFVAGFRAGRRASGGGLLHGALGGLSLSTLSLLIHLIAWPGLPGLQVVLMRFGFGVAAGAADGVLG